MEAAAAIAALIADQDDVESVLQLAAQTLAAARSASPEQQPVLISPAAKPALSEPATSRATLPFGSIEKSFASPSAAKSSASSSAEKPLA